MALLTPKDIREHTFQTVRFKEGYDVDEVDDFLDQVTETVEALGRQAVSGATSTQSLSPDVTNLNAKISELSNQVQQLQGENETLRTAAEGNGANQVDAAKLVEVEESNRALSSQNEQLKSQVDRLTAQIDQLTAQAAQASGDQEAVAQQIAAIQQERDQFRAANDELNGKVQEAQKAVDNLQQQASAQINDLKRQLEESTQRENALRAQVAKVEPSTETGSLQKIAGAASMAGTEPERATAMLTLAMQLHDQYVDKGKAKARELAEASQAKYEELVAQANDYSTRTRTEADDYRDRTHADADAYSQNVHNEADSYSQNVRTEADSYSVQTRQDADQYSKNQHDDADNYEVEVQRRAAEYDKTTRTGADTYAQQVRDNLAAQSKVVEGNIQKLKQFEMEYRARLTDFLGQLSAQIAESNNYGDQTDPSAN